jgi:hypothetical protein
MNQSDLAQVIECLHRVAIDQRSNTEPGSSQLPGRKDTDREPTDGTAKAPVKETPPPAKPANIGGIIQPY